MKRQIVLLAVAVVVVAISACYSIFGNGGLSQTATRSCGSIEGRVLDKKGLPVSGVKVYSRIMDRPTSPNSLGVSSDTDSQGRFFIGCAEPGRNGISVAKEDEYYPDTLTISILDPKPTPIPIVNVVDGQTVRGIEVHLPPKAGRLNIRVVDANTKARIEGATLTICRRDVLNKLRGPQCFVINANLTSTGYSQLLPPIAYTIKASAPGYDDWYYPSGSKTQAGVIQLAPEKIKNLVIALKPKR